jgi:hypothetical protein
MTLHAHSGVLGRLARRPGLGISAAVGLLLAVGACSRAPSSSAADDGGATNRARLEHRTALLQRELELAGEKDFYLLLDPAAPDLTLMLRGAELRRFQVLGLQVGYPRVSWFSRRDTRAWQGVIWSNGELDPPRLIDRIVVTAVEAAKGGDAGKADDAAEPPAIPPTPEELYRVPSRFRVRFSDGLSVEIRPREGDANTGRFTRLRAWWSAKWGDVAAAMRSSDRDAVRLRIILNPKDADSLYRSLPPAVRLLVLSGSPPPR